MNAFEPPSLKAEIAAAASAMVVEEGLEYGPAKRRALKQLGLPARTALPDNDALEDAVREYIALFCADTQPAELRALRELALVWMQRMADFRPFLGGAVWRGTATRLSDIYIQLFCDDPKSAEIALIEHQVDYEPRTVTGFTGDSVDARWKNPIAASTSPRSSEALPASSSAATSLTNVRSRLATTSA
mgnify:CR=1 FL=1